ncbi:MAG: cyclodeaminase/cyclohydrolase family protein [Oscillospiraceae bacterium]|nr:cyclodeaminase/cyclohydrolase family protein [Oscillospiraceae bacterium]
MDMTLLSCREFAEKLASKDPTPGGGGAAALVGALGASLGQMVTNLTMGKKTYAEFEDEMSAICAGLEDCRNALLDLVEEDEKAFQPLAKAYAIPKDDPNRASVLEEATLTACQPPMEMLRTCASAIALLPNLVEHGSRLAVSDAGCAATLLRAAMESAALNVKINTRALQDRAVAESLNKEMQSLLEKSITVAEAVYASVSKKLG